MQLSATGRTVSDLGTITDVYSKHICENNFDAYMHSLANVVPCCLTTLDKLLVDCCVLSQVPVEQVELWHYAMPCSL